MGLRHYLSIKSRFVTTPFACIGWLNLYGVHRSLIIAQAHSLYLIRVRQKPLRHNIVVTVLLSELPVRCTYLPLLDHACNFDRRVVVLVPLHVLHANRRVGRRALPFQIMHLHLVRRVGLRRLHARFDVLLICLRFLGANDFGIRHSYYCFLN